MNRDSYLSVLKPFVEFESREWADLICLTEDVLSMAEVPRSIEAFRRLLQDIEQRSGKPVILRAKHNCFSPKRCRRQFEHLRQIHEQQEASILSTASSSEVAIKREENIFGQFIDWLRRVKRLVIMVFEGKTVLDFMGVGLACDYRVATADTVFLNDYRFVDTPPAFGLLYLLPAYVGIGRAQELAMRTEGMTAKEAQEWGLLNEVVLTVNLVSALRTIAERMSVYSQETIASIKQMLDAHLPAHDALLSIECEGIRRTLKTHLLGG